jgi:Holliday junction resolvase RusA-like endonuclease
MDHRFTVEAKPVPASRPQVGRFGTYYPKSHATYESFLDKVLPFNKGEYIDQPFELRLMFVFDRYKTSDYPTTRSDVDNLSKLPMDCMTKAEFWSDDSLAVCLTATKRFCREGEKPHTKVRIIKFKGSVEDHVDRLFES